MSRIKIGINMPWRDYGKDFGVRGADFARFPLGPFMPPPKPLWIGDIPGDLKNFEDLGLFAVRWFIFGSGEMCGCTPGEKVPGSKVWTVDDAQIKMRPEILEDFKILLDAVGKRKLQLVPVFINHDFCWQAESGSGKTLPNPDPSAPGSDMVKYGRYNIINEEAKQDLFLERCLQPLLDLSKGRQNIEGRPVIYAWELISEPEGCTDVPFPNRGAPAEKRMVSKDKMRIFIKKGCKKINDAGFESTVGFQNYYSPRRNDAPNKEIPEFDQNWSTNDVNWDATDLGITLPQFHYYAHKTVEPKQLPKSDCCSLHPAFIGEIATTRKPTPERLWDLPIQDVIERVRKVESQKYPAVFLWAAFIHCSDRNPADENVDWGPGVTTPPNPFVMSSDLERHLKALNARK